MKLVESMAMIEALTNKFALMTPWEKRFTAGLVRIAGSGKCEGWTKSQAQTLMALYAKHVLLHKLPVEFHHNDGAPSGPPAGAGGPDEEEKPAF